MRILIVNKYHKITGGADRYAMALAKLLLENGHDVAFIAQEQADNLPSDYVVHSVRAGLTYNTWRSASYLSKARAYFEAIYNTSAAKTMKRVIKEFKPDLIHAHNIFYQISPSVYHVAHSRGIPIVQHLHDYHVVCANSNLFTNGRLCEDCRGYYSLGVLRHRCYNDHLSASWLALSARVIHKVTSLFPKMIDRFVSNSVFVKKKIESFNYSLAPIDHIPYFCTIIDQEPNFTPGHYIIYFGRIVPHKGLNTLVRAMENIDFPLVIVGTGDGIKVLKDQIRERNLTNIVLVGSKSGDELYDLIRGARFVVVPSEWYEPFGLVVLEAFALGKPVVASRIGGLEELVDPSVGVLFSPGDAHDLVRVVKSFIYDDRKVQQLGEAARIKVLLEYNPDDHLSKLLQSYRLTLQNYNR